MLLSSAQLTRVAGGEHCWPHPCSSAVSVSMWGFSCYIHPYCVCCTTLWIGTSRSTVHAWAPRKEEAYWVLGEELTAFNKSWISLHPGPIVYLRQFIYIYPLIPGPPNKHFGLWMNSFYGQKSPLRKWTTESVKYPSKGIERHRSHWEVIIQKWWALSVPLLLKLTQSRTGAWLCPGSCLGSLIPASGSVGRKGGREKREMGGKE